MNTETVALAERIAIEAHDGQFRRGGLVPYIEHPRSVVAKVGGDPDAQIVAWLHDVLEDCDVSAEQLRDRGIPQQCVDAVVLLTKTKELAYDDYLERLAQSPLATKVKIADMISNLADSPTNKQLKKYAKGLSRLTRDL